MYAYRIFCLKDLNKELSQKLEAQTQRFELLAAQQMANENLQTRPLDTQGIRDAADYTDEGDEVSCSKAIYSLPKTIETSYFMFNCIWRVI